MGGGEAGNIKAKQIFFDLLELKASWVRLGRARKKGKEGEGEERERAVTLSH